MTILRVAFQTLGCKLNQLETESIADRFLAVGASIVPFHDIADIYVVNTCTVTSKAEQKARRDIRAALARQPDAVIIVTGCYAQLDPAALRALGSRVLVLEGDLKAGLLSFAEWLGENWQGHSDLLYAIREWLDEIRSPVHKTEERIQQARDRFAFHPEHFAMHTRPALKIQDGCNRRCTYCRVCLARGPSVSLSADEALARVRALEAAGKHEVVLTGVNLAQYHGILSSQTGPADEYLDFPHLLQLLIQETNSIAFRISSYEPEAINEEFLSVFSNRRIQPHLHLSVQSGCTETLRRMGRPYNAQKVEEAVRSIRETRDDPFLACDIIAGFPGESEAEFEESFSLLKNLDFAWIHAFPFSPRPGTQAFDMKPRIPERIIGDRVARLLALAHEGKERYVKRWIGREVSLIIEQADSPDYIHGTSENYLKVAISMLDSTNRSAFSPLEVRELVHGAVVKATIVDHGFHADLVSSVDALAIVR